MGDVIIKIDEKERRLKYTFNSLAEIEDHLGLTIKELDKVLSEFDRIDIEKFKYLRCFVWVGLLHEDPGLKLFEFGEILEKFLLQEGL